MKSGRHCHLEDQASGGFEKTQQTTSVWLAVHHDDSVREVRVNV